MGAIAGYNASIFITSSPSVAVTYEVTNDAGDHKTYTIGNSAHKYLDKTATFTVRKSTDGGVTYPIVSANLYTVQYVSGTVVFNSANGSTDIIKFDCSYFPYATMGDAKSWEIQLNDTALESTAFTGIRWKTFIMALNDASIKLDKWWVDATFLTNMTNGALLVLSLYTGANSTNRYECYAYTKSASTKTAVANLIEQSLEFSVDGQVYCYA